MEASHRVDEQIKRQVLTGRDTNSLPPIDCRKLAAQLAGPLEKRHGLGQEALPVGRQRRQSSRAALLAIQFHSQPAFQFQKPAPQTLLRNVQMLGRRPQTAVTGQFDKSRHLVGR
jgi:hypothetical protein